MTMRCVLLCPEYFDGRLNGIGRVSELAGATAAGLGFRVEAWSANETDDVCNGGGVRFGRNYLRMVVHALTAPVRDIRAVVCMHAGLSPVARLLAFRAGCPFVVFFHGVEVWGRLRARTRWGIRGAKRILAVSEFTLRECLKSNPELHGLPMEIMPLGLMGAGAPPSKCWGSKPASAQVLLVTRLTKHCVTKNVRELILAMCNVIKQVPSASLIIVGEGDSRADLEKFTNTHALASAVRFVGRLGDHQLAEIYAHADVFAMPSKQEGFGLVFVEAMARGMPCVCGNRDASREVVEENVTGFAVDPDSPEAIGNAITKLLLDEPLRRRMGLAGWQRYREHFTREAVEHRIKTAMQESFGPTAE
jgi:phosphatidylinositol alpha-1,6-mannosyltransferase